MSDDIDLVEQAPGSEALKDDKSLTLASAFLRAEMTDVEGHRLLQQWRGDFFVWDDALGFYRRQVPEQFEAKVWAFLKTVRCRDRRRLARPYSPEPRKTRAVVEALALECQAHVDQMPAWLDDHRPDPADIVAFKNGLLNLKDFAKSPNVMLTPSHPAWFSELSLPYNFNPSAKCSNWLAFLHTVLPPDRQPGMVELLQEFFGYAMTADMRHQKLLVMVGPPRCGKGTIIRALQRIVGEHNVASPTFDSLAERFGLEPLIGKRVATIADAHLGRSVDAVRILDRILQVTGEDAVSIDRKGRAALPNVRLGVRFAIGCNELPDLPDNSGAIIARLLIVEFRESFVGREDLELDKRLQQESPGIATWALTGLTRLLANGRFTEPAGVEDMRDEYRRQTSPITGFLQERCEFGTTEYHWVSTEDIWLAWRQWAKANNHQEGTKIGFCKRLKTAAPQVDRGRSQEKHTRDYLYFGIRVRFDGELPL